MENANKSIHICNLCGKPLDEWDKQEGFGFEYHIGYGSRYDGEHVKTVFCCECFDRILHQLIIQCKVSPVVGEYT